MGTSSVIRIQHCRYSCRIYIDDAQTTNKNRINPSAWPTAVDHEQDIQ